MFTQDFMEGLDVSFRAQMERMGEGARAVYALLDGSGKPEADALRCLYASMPLCDALDYPPALFAAFAEHGVFLWERGPFAGRVPEKLFAGYVLHHRVNNEDLVEHRRFFYEELIRRVAGKGMKEAVLEVNYWCASQVAYRTTDDRTASPLCVYRSGFGRCGEESVFTVSVLRSLGIPARQVYVPLWSHCDDNHAWVEAWCDGEWVFLGACEPEEAVNRGWFVRAASRAMLVHSRWLLPVEPEKEDGGIASEGRDMSRSLNHLGRYAPTTSLWVNVWDPEGKPAEDARVGFEVMNGAGFGEIAALRTGRDGSCMFTTGKGTLHVTARRDGLYGECLVDTGKEEGCRIRLEAWQDAAGEEGNGWEELTFLAPEDLSEPCRREEGREKTADGSRRRRGAEEAAVLHGGRERKAEASRLLREKQKRLYDPSLGERAVAGLDGAQRPRCRQIMERACGNQREIADFLLRPTRGKWPGGWKTALLDSLREKDWRDVTADILEDACLRTAGREKDWEDALLIPYVLCPRVGNEMLRPYRAFLASWLEREDVRESVRALKEKSPGMPISAGEEIRKDPTLAWKLMQERIRPHRETEYGELVPSARSALESGYGSALTQATVCVQLLRTLGVPARLAPADGMPEAWIREKAFPEGHFVPLTHGEGTCGIHVCGREGIRWTYHGNWTLARLGENGWEALFPGEEERKGVEGSLMVFPGKYRILTADRLPGGNILAKQMTFSLKEGERKEICLEQAQAALSDMLTAYELTDFTLREEDGALRRASSLVKEGGGLFLWLGEGEEPTEHILNEICQHREEYARLRMGLYFVAARPQIREDPAFARVWKEVGNARLLLDDGSGSAEDPTGISPSSDPCGHDAHIGANMESLARRMYLEPGRLPLVVLVDPQMRGVYGVAGYNVGTGDMLLKLIREMRR